MPTRTRSQFTKRQALDANAEAWLHGEDCGLFRFKPDETLQALWELHGESIVERHVAESPGTRPERWWEFDAPRSPRGTCPGCYYDGKLCEPRERIGGVGTPDHEVLAVVPSFSFGVPSFWLGQKLKPKGVALDPDDPPLFESQASYLDRHGLFLPGERKRLT